MFACRKRYKKNSFINNFQESLLLVISMIQSITLRVSTYLNLKYSKLNI